MGKVNNIWDYISRHKYLLTTVVGLILVGVVDDNSVRSLIQLSVRLNECEDKLERYTRQYERDSISLRNFQAGLKGVETIARERYKMKRANEDVYILSNDRNYETEEDEWKD